MARTEISRAAHCQALRAIKAGASKQNADRESSGERGRQAVRDFVPLIDKWVAVDEPILNLNRRYWQGRRYIHQQFCAERRLRHAPRTGIAAREYRVVKAYRRATNHR